MNSLFVRLLVGMWLTMALLVGVFALIHAWATSSDPSAPRRRFIARVVELRADTAYVCAQGGGTGCEAQLAPLDERDDRIAIYRDGALLMGEPIAEAAAIDAEARRSEDGVAVRIEADAGNHEVTAVVLHRDPRVTAFAIGPVRSPWRFFIGPETLPHRLVAIVAVTGLVAFGLARWLSRPIGILRGATQQMAAGDLSVRVSPRLAGADSETLALGRDMDRMTERIEDLLEAQRRLLRDVSHELRSPLARLRIALELVRRRSPPDVAPAFDRIERDMERLDAMIGELLTLSRLEASHGLENPAPVDLAALVDQVAGDVAFEAEQHGARVEVGSRTECILNGSEELLRRAVENVLRNAVRFTEPGSTVHVALTRDGDTALLRVRDHGPGVPAESLEAIFKPFYRVGTDRARGTGGTGIGLAITHRAAVLHGGTVTAHNADGGGLEVVVRLPVRDAAAEAE